MKSDASGVSVVAILLIAAVAVIIRTDQLPTAVSVTVCALCAIVGLVLLWTGIRDIRAHKPTGTDRT